jgi:hypothetical protein
LGFFHFLLLAVASDKAYQLLAHGRWFSPASSTTKTGRHDIAEGGVKHQQSNQSIIFLFHAEAANRKQTVNIATRGTM